MDDSYLRSNTQKNQKYTKARVLTALFCAAATGAALNGYARTSTTSLPSKEAQGSDEDLTNMQRGVNVQKMMQDLQRQQNFINAQTKKLGESADLIAHLQSLLALEAQSEEIITELESELNTCESQEARYESTLIKAEDLGGSGCTNSNPCGIGQGDCDNDSDCLPGLKCFQKDTEAAIPGIDTASLRAIGIPAHDWCYDPNWNGLMKAWNKGGSGCTSSKPCGVGEGDCDNDSDCLPGLKCFQKETDVSIPGIDTTSLRAIGIKAEVYDWCYDPNWKGLMKAWDKGGSGCTSSKPCGVGEGDCDNDSDCLPGLKCFQRDTEVPIPGIDTDSLKAIGIPAHDWCYDPTF